MVCHERQIDRVGLLGVTDFLPSPKLVQEQLHRSAADRNKMRRATNAFYETWMNLHGNTVGIAKLGRLALLKTTSFNVELAHASFLGRARNEGPDVGWRCEKGLKRPRSTLFRKISIEALWDISLMLLMPSRF